MDRAVRIGLIGDYNAEVTAHLAIPRALELAGAAIGAQVRVTWLATETLDGRAVGDLTRFDALWCVPASPYASMEGALRAIRFARETGRPFLGTCGGFQHALIEYARDVLGLTEADHAESSPEAALPLIAPLACSLVERDGLVRFLLGSRVRAIYGVGEATEQYHCSFGLNARYTSLIDDGGLCITGVDEGGEARVVELQDHPFFIATLYQPERSALAGRRHPLVTAFVQAAVTVRATDPATRVES